MDVQGKPYHPDFPKSRWVADKGPLWLNFSDPTIFNLAPPNNTWPNYLDIVTHTKKKDAWVYLVITSDQVKKGTTIKWIPAAHPIHLHGHDFALLAQSKPNEKFPGIANVKIKTDNPPRRDVVLLPKKGYIVIAFKADNPGAWIVHCHIAWHASSGLGFQILENKHLIKINPDTEAIMHDQCDKWDAWWGNQTNRWGGATIKEFQDDSGI